MTDPTSTWLPSVGDPHTIGEASRELLVRQAPTTAAMREILDQAIAVSQAAAANHPENSEMAVLWGLLCMIATAYSLVLVNEDD